MAVTPSEIEQRTLDHYRESFAEHGDTPRGVDWNGEASQRTQFEQLLKLLPPSGDFSVNDFGCGYGALVDLLTGAWSGVRYRGYDLNADMISAAQRRYASRSNCTFHVADRPLETAHYGLASGVFTLKLGRSDAQCLEDLTQALDALDRTSSQGFAFNCLTSYSDPEKMRDYLYYPDPTVLFDLCKRRYARNVALLHDYDLYACTLIVRKTAVRP